MKKFKAIFTTVLMTVLTFCMLAFVGCGSDLAGTYKLQSITYDGVVYEVGDTLEGVVLSEDMMTAELKDNGTFIFRMNMMGDTETEDGTWEELENGNIILREDDIALECECDGETLVIGIQDYMTYTLVK